MKQHSIYCFAFRHFFKNLENMLRLRQVQFIHRSVSPYKISRISCVNIFTMGKRTLAIRHTLEKNLFHKFCLTGLVIKHLFPYCSLRTEKEPLWLRYIYWKNADTISHSKVGEDENFSLFMCTKATYDNRLRKKTFLQPDIWHKVTTLATCRDECK